MNIRNATTLSAASAVLLGLGVIGTAGAAPIACGENPENNYMTSTGVDACLDSGVRNLTGNPDNDLFINGVGGDYESAGKSDGPNTFGISYDNSSWSFGASFWDMYSAGAIGFKFGTGNTPDEWMVYSLTPGSTSGSYEFFAGSKDGAPGGTTGRLSHINLYGVPGTAQVPEPMTLGLLGLGLVGLAMAARRRRQQ